MAKNFDLLLVLLLGSAGHLPPASASLFSGPAIHFPNICKDLGICVNARFRVYSTCTPTHNELTPGGMASNVTFTLHATLELNSTKETYHGHYDFNADDDARKINWNEGKTRVNVTVTQDSDNDNSNDTLWCADGEGCDNVNAKVYRGRCGAASPLLHYESLAYKEDGSPNLDPSAPTSPSRTMEWSLPLLTNQKALQGSLEVDGLMDYEDAQSVVVVLDDANTSICCNLEPILPSLPNEFSAVIEANFEKPGRGESYTMIRKEYYSALRNVERLDEHSHKRSSVEIRNYREGKHYTLFRNNTFPNGVCFQESISEGENHMNTFNGNLQSTARFLSFSHPSAMMQGGQEEDYLETYHGSDHSVRGIRCEKWTHPMHYTPTYTDAGTNEYTVSHFFPETDWRVRGESYHRLPKRVLLNGTHADGTQVLHYYDFIDMQPYILDADMVFDPCLVMGQDFEGNCKCPTKRICVDIDTQHPNPEPGGIMEGGVHPVQPPGATELDELCHKYGTRRGLPPGAVVAVAFSMLLLGTLGTLMTLCAVRRCKSRKALAHQQFDDMSMEMGPAGTQTEGA